MLQIDLKINITFGICVDKMVMSAFKLISEWYVVVILKMIRYYMVNFF